MEFIVEILRKLPVLLLISLAALYGILGDLFAKYWALNRTATFWILTVVFYCLSGIIFMPSLLKEGLIIAAMIWVLVSAIGFLFLGIVVFKETLTTLQMLGVFLGIASLIMLNLGK